MQLAFNLKRTIFSLLFLSFLLIFQNKSFAFQKATVDTISTADVDFAPLPADTVPATKAATPVKKEVSKEKSKAIEATQEQQSLWAIFLAGLLGGFAALIMPCIFPMLPLTVSYFTKTAQSRGSAISKALIYGLSIIVIYVAFGLIITVIFGADALNDLATNGVFNLIFFLLLIIFAVSFFGAFEITLPSAWANKMDEQSDKGGWLGLFFMAATLALVSFSCTGPIIGTLLVQAATSGALLGPAVGMFGFSLALAIPFALFAMFPSWLNSLPKSGGWLNSVKVVLGFLELALALKFLSNVDLAYHWEWFDREIFLVLWIVIFGLMGLYLLGKLKFSHDSPVEYLSIPRLFLAIIVLSFTIYMVPGLWGAPLKSISAFLPPQQTQDFDLYTPTIIGNHQSTSISSNDNTTHKYADIFKAPLGLNAFFDYDEGLAYAKKNHKPIMIDFTGHACVNCRKMEASVWTDKNVYSLINNDFVLIQLYVDDKTDLQPTEQTISPRGKKIKTIGNKWSEFQISKFKANAQPFYTLLDDDGNLLVQPQGADYNAESYGQFLQSGLTAFKEK
jgi:thiol:disulfide interchange protein